VWIGAVEKDVLLILYFMNITQVTSRGGIVSPGHSFKSLSTRVGTKSEASHAANNVARKLPLKIKKHVSRKGVWRMCDQGPLGREGAPLMGSGAFAVALLWMNIRIRCPIIQVPPREQLSARHSTAYVDFLFFF